MTTEIDLPFGYQCDPALGIFVAKMFMFEKKHFKLKTISQDISYDEITHFPIKLIDLLKDQGILNDSVGLSDVTMMLNIICELHKYNHDPEWEKKILFIKEKYNRPLSSE